MSNVTWQDVAGAIVFALAVVGGIRLLVYILFRKP